MLVINKAQHRSDAIQQGASGQHRPADHLRRVGARVRRRLGASGEEHRRTPRGGDHPRPEGDPDRQRAVRCPPRPVGAHGCRRSAGLPELHGPSREARHPDRRRPAGSGGRDPAEEIATDRGAGNEAPCQDGIPGHVLHHAVDLHRDSRPGCVEHHGCARLVIAKRPPITRAQSSYS